MTEKNKEQLLELVITAGTCLGTVYIGHFCCGDLPNGYGGQRAMVRADRRPKEDLGSPGGARLRAIWQRCRHGETCYPYQVGGKYYTGHRKDSSFGSWFKTVFG